MSRFIDAVKKVGPSWPKPSEMGFDEPEVYEYISYCIGDSIPSDKEEVCRIIETFFALGIALGRMQAKGILN